MEYLLITAPGSKGYADPTALNDQVNAKLKEGYKPHGDPSIVFDPRSGNALYYQALVKE